MAANAAPNFRQWLRQGTNMKLSTNANANRVIAEGLNDLNALLDFDKDSLEALPKACSRALPAVEADPDNDQPELAVIVVVFVDVIVFWELVTSRF